MRLNSKLTQRLTAVILGVALLLLSIPFVSFADMTEVYVSTETELRNALSSESHATTKVVLQNDIQISSSWETVDEFGGELNGNGHIVSGVSKPLIDTLTGRACNIGIVAADNVEVRTDTLFVSTVDQTDSSAEFAISSSFVYGAFKLPAADADIHAGGLVGTLKNGAVKASFACISINGSATPASYVGGLIGKIEGGTVTSCYSAGDIAVDGGHVAGLANLTSGVVDDTYTTCQMRIPSATSKPSGVNGLYDNQLTILRENKDNFGLTTTELLNTTALSSAFLVTSTAYPAISSFYNNMWTETVLDIVRVSIAAAAFTDVDPSVRKEPAADTFFARIDYLTRDVLVDRTNTIGLYWGLDTPACKLYDTVPTTEVSQPSTTQTATSADLLRARLQFSQNVSDAVMSVTSNQYVRKWYLTAADVSPYFTKGDGRNSAPYGISTVEQLDYVRYYTTLGTTAFRLVNDIVCGEFASIDSLNGTFDGQNYKLSDLTLYNPNGDTVALFLKTVGASTVKNLLIQDATVKVNNSANAAVLFDTAENAVIENVMLCGENNVESLGTVGGIAAKATNCTMKNILVSVEANGSVSGGVVGTLNGGSLTSSGVTGCVIGDTFGGGLIAKADGGAMIDACYSTALVLSKATAGSVAVGGLVGELSGNAAVQNSYVAGLANAVLNTANVGIAVGNGTVGSDCYFDSNCCQNDNKSGTARSTADLIGSSLGNVWTTTADHYPQIKVFADNARTAPLSALSTLPIYFQKYWNDAASADLTTGWIPETYSQDGVITSADIEKYDVFGEGLNSDKEGQWIYAVNNGFGFEAKNGSSKTAVKVTIADVGIRITAALRENMVSLTYTVTGVAEARAYLNISFGDDETSMKTFEVMSAVGSTNRLYDVPVGSLLKVSAKTDDIYKVAQISVNGTILSEIGTYTLDGVDNDALITITLETATPLWGLRRQTY